DRDRLGLLERRHAGHAAQPRLAVDLHRTGAALAGLAVPPHGEVGGLGRLETVDHIQDYLAVVDLDLVVLELAAGVVAAPDPEMALLAHYSPSLPAGRSVPGTSIFASSSSVRYFASSAGSNRESSSGRIFGSAFRSRRTSSPSSEQTRLTLRQLGSIFGKS